MYNLHIYIREIEKLHVITHEWKYIDIVNSCIFFVWIWRDEKQHISCRNSKRWDGTVLVLASSVLIAAWGNCTFYDQESLQNTIYDKSLQSLSNAHLDIESLRIYNGKSDIVKSWNIS